jgi:hypothetical protein
MLKRDPRIDAYIRNAPDFARPILTHLRKLVHQACPKVEEALKWNVPFFLYDGKNLLGMTAFKAHCAFGFWKGSYVRIESLKDIPPARVFQSLVKQTIKLNETGAVVKRAAPARKPAIRPPAKI